MYYNNTYTTIVYRVYMRVYYKYIAFSYITYTCNVYMYVYIYMTIKRVFVFRATC